MRGNTNTYVANINLLTPSIVASKVRFVPYSQHPRTVCMRVEVFGCRYEDAIVAYRAPPGEPHLDQLPVTGSNRGSRTRSYKKNSSVDFPSALKCWPIREAKNSHVTNLIGQFQRKNLRQKFYRIGSRFIFKKLPMLLSQSTACSVKKSRIS